MVGEGLAPGHSAIKGSPMGGSPQEDPYLRNALYVCPGLQTRSWKCPGPRVSLEEGPNTRSIHKDPVFEDLTLMAQALRAVFESPRARCRDSRDFSWLVGEWNIRRGKLGPALSPCEQG